MFAIKKVIFVVACISSVLGQIPWWPGSQNINQNQPPAPSQSSPPVFQLPNPCQNPFLYPLMWFFCQPIPMPATPPAVSPNFNPFPEEDSEDSVPTPSTPIQFQVNPTAPPQNPWGNNPWQFPWQRPNQQQQPPPQPQTPQWNFQFPWFNQPQVQGSPLPRPPRTRRTTTTTPTSIEETNSSDGGIAAEDENQILDEATSVQGFCNLNGVGRFPDPLTANTTCAE